MRRNFRRVRYRASQEIYHSFGAFLFSAHSHGNLWERYETTFLNTMRKESNRGRSGAPQSCPWFIKSYFCGDRRSSKMKCPKLGKAHGGWYEFARDLGMEDGRWKAIPWFYFAWPLVVRSDLLKGVGEV